MSIFARLVQSRGLLFLLDKVLIEFSAIPMFHSSKILLLKWSSPIKGDSELASGGKVFQYQPLLTKSHLISEEEFKDFVRNLGNILRAIKIVTWDWNVATRSKQDSMQWHTIGRWKHIGISFLNTESILLIKYKKKGVSKRGEYDKLQL